MNVTLIKDDFCNAEYLINKMYVAARTCYSNKTPNELLQISDSTSINSKINLIKQVLSSGHQSIAEHISFSFSIEGISRSCSHQLVRHRLAVYSQQSQRYCSLDEGKSDFYVIPPSIASTFSTNKDFAKSYIKLMVDIQNLYNDMVEQGIKAEDARYILPNATVTNIVMTCNLRQWSHICNLRLCTRAQWEIREVFKNIVSELEKQYPELIPIFDELLVPQCEALGYCPEPESRCCGRRFNKDQVFNN